MENIETLKQRLKDLNLEYRKINQLPVSERGQFGRQLNQKKQDLLKKLAKLEADLLDTNVEPLDVTAPMAVNANPPQLLTSDLGSRHPLMTELDRVVEIYQRMGFDVIEPRQLDDEYHMFDALNFPDEHPARDDYDTFRTVEKAADGRGFIPPAHTSTMQHRVLKEQKTKLERGEAIACVVPGRVFRNEDVDATHEHTFYQCEGVYVAEQCSLANMLGILRSFFEQYYGQKLNVKTQPGYFPFTEPSLEFMIEKPLSIAGEKGQFLEMLGCGMIHPNVLKMAGIDPSKYCGFAWGGGIDRLVMLKFELDDVRNFEAGKLSFLKEFK